MLVADIDEPVVAAATRTPFEARRRVFVIEAADTMGDATANRLLKTLEEPADFVHLILLTARPGEVLPTVASRCQHVRFEAPSAARLAARLEAGGRRRRRSRRRAGASRSATASARWALALGDGPALRDAAQALRGRGARAARSSERPWMALLELAKRARASAPAASSTALHVEDLELVARSERARFEREHAERVKRARAAALGAHARPRPRRSSSCGTATRR